MPSQVPYALIRRIQQLTEPRRTGSPSEDVTPAVAKARGTLADQEPTQPGQVALEGQTPPASESVPMNDDIHAKVMEIARTDPELLDYFIKKGLESELPNVAGFKQGIAPAGAGPSRMGPESEFSDTMAQHADPNDMEALMGEGGNAPELGMSSGGKLGPSESMGKFGLPSHSDLEAMGLPGQARDYLTDEELQQLPSILAKLNKTQSVDEAAPELDPFVQGVSDRRRGRLDAVKDARTDAETDMLLADENLDLRGSAKNERASDLAMRSSYNRGTREKAAQAQGAKGLTDMRVVNERSGKPTDEVVELNKKTGRTFAPSRELIEEGKYKRSSPVNPDRLHQGQPPSSFEMNALQREGLKSTEAIDRSRANQGKSDLTEDYARTKASSIANERRAGYHRFYNKDNSLDHDTPSVSPPSMRQAAAQDYVPPVSRMSRNPDVDTRTPQRARMAQQIADVTDDSRPDPRGLQNTGDARLQNYRREVNKGLNPQDRHPMHESPGLYVQGRHGEVVEASGGQPVHKLSSEYSLGEMNALHKEPKSYRGGGNGTTDMMGPRENPGLQRQRMARDSRENRKGKFQEYLEKKGKI